MKILNNRIVNVKRPAYISKLEICKIYLYETCKQGVSGGYRPPEASDILDTHFKWKHLLDYFFSYFRGRAISFFLLIFEARLFF